MLQYAGKDQARIWFLREELSKVEYHDENIVDYICSLEKLFHLLAAASEVQAKKDKKYLLLSKLPQAYHPFRTSICNNANYENIKYDPICDRLVLEHQQFTQGTGPHGESDTTNAFYTHSRNGRGGYAHAGGKGPGREKAPDAKDSCFCCKEKGHWANKCLVKQQTKQRPRNGTGGRREGWRDAGRPSAHRAAAERGDSSSSGTL